MEPVRKSNVLKLLFYWMIGICEWSPANFQRVIYIELTSWIFFQGTDKELKLKIELTLTKIEREKNSCYGDAHYR